MQENTFQPEQYDTLWQQKVDSTLTLFNGLNTPEAQRYASPSSGFRMRAEFKIWHEGDTWNYVMFKRNSKHEHFIIESFPIASNSIQAVMPELRKTLIGNELLSRKLFQVEFLSTTTGDMLVTLIYHKKLNETWLEEAKALASSLGIKIIGRARKQKLVTHEDYVLETLTIEGEDFTYQQVEGGFTQPNAAINTRMLTWACEKLGSNQNDLLELYCGNGNFTMPLARRFNNVLATEISKTSVNSALYNCRANGVDNISFIRMSSEEFTQALNGEREFRRLKDVDIHEYDMSTVLVDPPRAGLDDGTVELIRRFDRILYISCNPETLADNLNALQSDFEITELAFFDQFPYTHHIESGVVLTKRR